MRTRPRVPEIFDRQDSGLAKADLHAYRYSFAEYHVLDQDFRDLLLSSIALEQRLFQS